MTVVKHSTRLLGDILDTASTYHFSDMTLRNLRYLHNWPSFQQRVGPDDLQRSLPT